MAYRCAILDDYQNVALKLADWSKITKDVEIKVFTEAVRRSDADTIRDCKDFDIVVMMRERTRFPRAVIDGAAEAQAPHHHRRLQRLDRHEGLRSERGIVVCGTGGFGNPTTGIAFGLILELTRRIGWEHARMKSGVPWQSTLGMDIEGKTLGVLGLGKLGARAAGVGKAFGMKVIAWSQNLTPERCKEVGAEYVSKDDLFRNADVVTIHLVLGDRTRGLVGARELGLMKKTAYLVNTSRGPIVEEKALLEALNNKQIAGAGLDVFDVEAGAGDLLFVERVEQRLFLDDRPARGVDHVGSLLHQAEFFGGDEAAGAVAELKMHRDDVGVAEQVVLGDVFGADLLASLRRQILAPGDHLHAERLADTGGPRAELAEPEHAECLAFDVHAERVLPRHAGFHPRVLPADPAGQFEDQAEGDAGGRIAEAAVPQTTMPRSAQAFMSIEAL